MGEAVGGRGKAIGRRKVARFGLWDGAEEARRSRAVYVVEDGHRWVCGERSAPIRQDPPFNFIWLVVDHLEQSDPTGPTAIPWRSGDASGHLLSSPDASGPVAVGKTAHRVLERSGRRGGIPRRQRMAEPVEATPASPVWKGWHRDPLAASQVVEGKKKAG
ncbi:hypothetical protein LX36DRAFT_444494 [Colletotrichum falcatum]|nr:hypothetical protein LX36DRAFT_444494 [Colletotrichum falcatum]